MFTRHLGYSYAEGPCHLTGAFNVCRMSIGLVAFFAPI